MRGVSPPCYLHLNRWIPVKDVRKLIWSYLTEVDMFIVRLAHGAAIDDYPFKEMPSIFSGYCGANGYMSLLQWAHASGIAVDGPSICRGAAIRGDYEMLKWTEKKNLWLSPEASYFAVLYNHFALVKWLYYNDFPFGDQIFFAAVSSKRINYSMLRWLRNKMGQPSTPELYLVPLENGNLKLVNWLYRNGVVLKTPGFYPTLWAIKSGDLRVIKWVLERGCILSTLASETAVRLQKWEIFKWLRTTAKCPVGMRECLHLAITGNLPMLIWAYENGCKLNRVTLEFPVEEKNFECIAWARAHGCPWGPSTMRLTIQSANLKAVQWLHERECPWPLGPVFGTRFEIKHCPVMEWALAHGCPWPDDLCTFEPYYSPEVKEWLTVHGPHPHHRKE